MKKQGFTLIELMVVIVIMGILAAVAVPKLFGMIAKSKASEVGPAAGTYVKLQQAYAAEQNAIGGWTLIGYAAPGNGSTTNFNYTGAVTADGTATASTANAWKAASKVDLNDCKATSAWSLTAAPGVGGAVTINTVLTQAASSGTGACLALTPSFHQIGDGQAN